MIHINNSTGESKKIIEMSDEHLRNTIKMLLDRLILTSQQESYEDVLRVEEDLSLLSEYILIAMAKGLWYLTQTMKLEQIIHNYGKNNSRFCTGSESMSSMQEHHLLKGSD